MGKLNDVSGFFSDGKRLKRWGLRFLTAIWVRFESLLFWAAFAFLTLIALWCIGAFFHAFDLPEFAAWSASAVLTALLVTSLFFRRVLPTVALLELVPIIAYQAISPEERFAGTVWQKPWKRTLEVRRFAGGSYELRNVRDFHYRSENDFDIRYRTVTVSLDRISSIDIVFSYWDNMEGIAHSMLGLNFSDGTTVVISLETRLPDGSKQNGLDGFYRRYGLAMLAGTPEDLYGLRTDHRGETLYVYRLRLDHESLRDMAVSVFARAAELQRKPQFYNSLFQNCTTGLLPIIHYIDRSPKNDIRILLNGQAAKMLYDKDKLCHRENESFGSLRARSLVPGLCRGKDAPPVHYAGESEARWLRSH